MIKTQKQAKKIQHNRYMLGARGISKAVRRFYMKLSNGDWAKYRGFIDGLDSDWTGCRRK